MNHFCYLCCVSVMLFVCSLQPCGHLLGKGLPLGSLVCNVFLRFVTIPCGVLGQVWYLIVSIPDVCLLLTLTFMLVLHKSDIISHVNLFSLCKYIKQSYKMNINLIIWK